MSHLDALYGGNENTTLGTIKHDCPQATTRPKADHSARKSAVKSSKVMVEAKTVDELETGFIALDFETTGLSPRYDRIVEIGAVRFKGDKIVERLSMLINPGFPMPAAASAVNHITDEMLVDKPTEGEAIGAIMEFLGDALEGKTLLVAHNARFDISFLSELLSRQGIEATIRYADTLSMSRHLIWDLYNYKQPTLAKHFRIRNPQEHRAEADAETCGLIMCKLLNIAEAEVEQDRKWI